MIKNKHWIEKRKISINDATRPDQTRPNRVDNIQIGVSSSLWIKLLIEPL